MVDVSPRGYSASQVVLHWLVAALVVFLFVTGDNTTEAFSAGLKGTATGVNWAWIPVHVIAGLVILGAMLWRLSLRWRLGAPEVPTSEPALLRWLASAVHTALYADMIAGAITGILAYFWLPGLAGLHDFSRGFRSWCLSRCTLRGRSGIISTGATMC